MGKFVKKSLSEICEETNSDLVSKEMKNLPKESMIDYEDIPALSADQLSRMKPVGNRFMNLVPKAPRSQKVSIRFELQVLEGIKEEAADLGKPYQTHINDILRTYVAEHKKG